jgi:hypothetical protein
MRIAMFEASGERHVLAGGSLLGEADAVALAEASSGAATISLPGACDPNRLETLLSSAPELRRVRWIFGSPLKLAASGEPRRWEALVGQGLRIEYRETLPLLLLTINPFYPRYLPGQFAYEPAQVEAETLLRAVQSTVKGVPVYDIRQEAVELLR